MRPERNPLDLNNFPEDFSSRDGKQTLDDTSSSAGGGGGWRKKKSGGKEESEKVYECRFCSLKFCKSQALGGHMNRHRQERETETLNRARQLVFSNENLVPQPCGQPMLHGGYHHQAIGSMNDQTLQFRSSSANYPPHFIPGTASTTILPPPQPQSQPYIYPSSSRILSYSSPQSVNDYFAGHIFPNNNHLASQTPEGNNYTCIGAPVGQGFMHSNGNIHRGRAPPDIMVPGGSGGGREMLMQNQQRMDVLPISRYQDGF